MSWLYPWGLLGLVSVPVLVALSLWRRQRREVVASSLLLWRQVAEERRRAPAAQPRRRIDPLLAVRVAAALVLTAALCGLLWLRAEPASRRLVLVLDRSASMAMLRPGGRSRWAACQERLHDLLATLGDGDRVRLLPLPARTGTPIPSELDPSQAATVLRDLAPSDAPLAPRQLAEAATDAARTFPHARVVVATDAPLEGLPDGAEILTTGGPAANRGIVAFAARRRPDGRHEVLVRVASTTGDASPAGVGLLADGEELAAPALREVQRSGGQVVFEAALDAVSILEARLDARDALAADDRAWLARRVGALRVALRGEQSRHLRRALAVAVQCEFARQVAASEECDLAVYYRTVPDELSGRPPVVVVVAPRAPVGRLRPLRLREAAGPTAVERRDPLMAAVELDGVKLGRVPELAVPPGFETLAQAGTTPLIGRWQEGQATVIYVGIDPEASGWPLTPSFPIFWANVVAGGEFASVRPGEFCHMGRPGQTLSVRGPQGSILDVQGGVFRPERAGLYQATGDDGRSAVAAVSLLSEAESAAIGAELELPDGPASKGPAKGTAASVRLSAWFALLGLGLIVAHGWLMGRVGRDA